MAGSVIRVSSDMKKLAEVFAEDSENDATFYGFSDTELIDHTNSDGDHEDCPDISTKKESEVKSKASATIKPFRLRIALVSAPSLQQSSYEDEEDEDKMTAHTGVQRPRKAKRTKKERHGVKSADEETEVTGPGSDVNEEVSDHFLAKREQNIKANKAMLAQLMTDLQKMPGGAGFLKKQAGKRKTIGQSSRPPQSGLTVRESKKNLERTSHRPTRSMKRSEEPSPPKEEDVELSIEDDLLEVRRAPQRRGTSRPKQSKPHNSSLRGRHGRLAESVIRVSSDMKKLAEVFEEDSENDATFYGFSDTELIDHTNSDGDHEDCPDISTKKESEVKSKASATIKPFRLRIALVSAPSLQQSSYEDEEDEDIMTAHTGVQRPRKDKRPKKERHGVKSADEETEVTEGPGSDVNEEVSDQFLAKREQNIKANKAMLAQLMADLQKMPGGAGFLKKQAGKQKTKGQSSRPPQSGLTGRESKKNPERTSRRLTRSMKRSEEPSPPKEEDVELSIEEELLEVRRAPQRRGTSRPKQSKPHIIRPVEDVTEDELQLVADNMTDKVYNTVTGSTCHQCRQKTVDTKTCCRSDDCRGIQGQFCGPCLRNRYGEDVKKALLDPNWKCPPCRGICNCSFCRQRDGRCPTGILFPLAQYCGFSDVHSYLTSLRDKLKGEEKVEM